MILADFGTSYCKIIDFDKNCEKPQIVATKKIDRQLRVDLATGHNGKRFAAKYVNELTALARGGEELITAENYVLLDCGSRDLKFVRYEDNRLADMGWNTECGASMGFTIELLERYYELDFNKLEVPDKTFSITCGVLGMSHIFDAVTSGISEAVAVARFVKGIAINAYRFAGSPDIIYLSGGLCANRLFVESFPCRVVPLGRFVLLRGLESEIRNRVPEAGNPKTQSSICRI